MSYIYNQCGIKSSHEHTAFVVNGFEWVLGRVNPLTKDKQEHINKWVGNALSDCDELDFRVFVDWSMLYILPELLEHLKGYYEVDTYFTLREPLATVNSYRAYSGDKASLDTFIQRYCEYHEYALGVFEKVRMRLLLFDNLVKGEYDIELFGKRGDWKEKKNTSGSYRMLWSDKIKDALKIYYEVKRYENS